MLAFLLLLFAALVLLLVIPATRGMRDAPPGRPQSIDPMKGY